MLTELIKFFDSRTWFLMLLSLIITIAYFVFLFSNNTNTPNVQTFFNLVIGFWFGAGSAAVGAGRAVAAVVEKVTEQSSSSHNTQINQ